MDSKKNQTIVIALDEPNTLRDRLGCAEWAMTENIKIMREIGDKDMALLSGLSHNSLKNIDLQDAYIANIDHASFANCETLETIVLPMCDSIPEDMFNNCASLYDVKMQSTTSNINKRAFFGCSKLEKIELPQTLSAIGADAFCNCINLKEIICRSTFPPLCNESSFKDIHKQCKVIIPTGCHDNYSTANVWKNFKIEEEVK